MMELGVDLHVVVHLCIQLLSSLGLPLLACIASTPTTATTAATATGTLGALGVSMGVVSVVVAGRSSTRHQGNKGVVSK